MKKHLKYWLAAFLLICLTAAPAQAAATPTYGWPGYVCKQSYLESGRLLIGDSRTCQMWHVNHKSGSYMAVWAGHYTYGGQKYQIDLPSRYNYMKNIARRTIERKGYCKIFVFATINDYEGGSDYAAWAQKVYRLGYDAWSWSGVYNGKTIHPKVYLVSLVPNKNEEARVVRYNDYLESLSGRSKKIKGFIDIRDCIPGADGGYEKDRCHYSVRAVKDILKKIKSY